MKKKTCLVEQFPFPSTLLPGLRSQGKAPTSSQRNQCLALLRKAQGSGSLPPHPLLKAALPTPRQLLPPAGPRLPKDRGTGIWDPLVAGVPPPQAELPLPSAAPFSERCPRPSFSKAFFWAPLTLYYYFPAKELQLGALATGSCSY